VNKVILIGFLGEAPELKFSPQGKPVCTFSLAVNERWKDPEGARRERVEWFQIVCFARLAEDCGQYLDRSRHVYIEGRLQTRKWEDRGGEKRTTIEVVANQMQILDRAPKNGNGAKAAESSKAAQPVDESDNPFNEPGSETRDQEIPF
jgi:single-strand DNA-binding protein